MSKEFIQHYLLRFSLGFVLFWFGCLQTMAPSDWLGFIPAEIKSAVPFPPTSLVFMHGVGLALAGLGITFGVFFRAANFLAAVLLTEIIVALALLGLNENAGLIVRDVALWAMAIFLALDTARVGSVLTADRFSFISARSSGPARTPQKLQGFPD